MIMLWNQKEVFAGYSMKEFNEVREILSSNNIKYKYRLVNNNAGASRSRTGSFGENLEYSTMYYIYVHQRDYENAQELLK